MNNDQSTSQTNDKTYGDQKKIAENLILDRLNRLYSKDDSSTQTIPKNSTPKIDSSFHIPQIEPETAETDTDLDVSQTTQQTTEQSQTTQTEPTVQLTNDSVYQQTYQTSIDQNQINQEWQKYHSAWQNYYQKYYEYYYTQQLKQQSATTEQQESNLNPEDSALDELRQKIRSSMVDTAKKARKSQHFWPIASALAVGLFFIFLQYNRLFIAQAKAYITPAEEMPEIVVANPNIAIDVGPDPWLIIPKINVKVPVVYNASNDEASQQNAMRKGVSHFRIPGASSYPGQLGNTIFNGHSSNDVFDKGDYKFIFTKLDKLAKNDTIYVDYKGTRYTYIVTKSEVILPHQINKLLHKNDKPRLTLVTCTPVGTSQKRLIVTAEQVSPDIKKTPANQPQITKIKRPKTISGNSKTFFEKVGDLFK